MAIVLRRGKSPHIPAGWHAATIKGVELERNVAVYWGTADRLKIRFVLDDGDRTLIQRYIAHLSERSELGLFLTGLLGELPDEFDMATLVGSRCRIRVEHRQGTNSRLWAQVAEAKSLSSTDNEAGAASDVDNLFDDEELELDGETDDYGQ